MDVVMVYGSADEGEEGIELPLDEDGTLGLPTLRGVYPMAVGLKFKNPESGNYRSVLKSECETKLILPTDTKKKFIAIMQTTSIQQTGEKRQRMEGESDTHGSSTEARLKWLERFFANNNSPSKDVKVVVTKSTRHLSEIANEVDSMKKRERLMETRVGELEVCASGSNKWMESIFPYLYYEICNERKHSVTILTTRHAATFQHKSHEALKVGDPFVIRKEADPDYQRTLRVAKVVPWNEPIISKNISCDYVILEAQAGETICNCNEVPEPVLDLQEVKKGDRFITAGYTQPAESQWGIVCGEIVTEDKDWQGRITGSAGGWSGNSGAPCFGNPLPSDKKPKLMGMAIAAPRDLVDPYSLPPSRQRIQPPGTSEKGVQAGTYSKQTEMVKIIPLKTLIDAALDPKEPEKKYTQEEYAQILYQDIMQIGYE